MTPATRANMPPWTLRETPAPGAVVVWTVGSAVLVPVPDSVSVPVPEADSVARDVDMVDSVPVALASVVVVSASVSVEAVVSAVVVASVLVIVETSEVAEVVISAEVVALLWGEEPSMVKVGVKL